MTEPHDPSPVAVDELAALIQRFGRQLTEEPSRLRGLLRDVAGQYRLEITLLVAAAEEGIATQLAYDPAGALPTARIAQMTSRLVEARGFSEPNAAWAVRGWVTALAPIAEPVQNAGPASASDVAVPPPPAWVPTPTTPDPVPSVGDPGPGSRKPWWLVASILLVVIAAGGLVFALTRGGSGEDPPSATAASGPTGSVSTSPSTGATSIAEALPAGEYQVKARITSKHSYTSDGWRGTFTFSAPECSEDGTRCSVQIGVEGGTGTLSGTPATGVSGPVDDAIFASCHEKSIENEVTRIAIDPISGTSTPDRITGRLSVRIPETDCSAGGFVADLVGFAIG